jgi:membrane protease YdiL (CAAX protease family)
LIYKLYLSAEFTFLFLLLPLFIHWYRNLFARLLIPTLFCVALACILVLLKDTRFDRKQLWNQRMLPHAFMPIFKTFIAGATILVILVLWLTPELFLGFPRRRPIVWLLVMFLYPLLSVYPQELIFRAFFFHRYQTLFPNQHQLVMASALSFGMAHIIFANWVAPLLSTLGGILFAITYSRHRSLALVCVEHSLWGNLIFTIGLGWYFYGGAMVIE